MPSSSLTSVSYKLSKDAEEAAVGAVIGILLTSDVYINVNLVHDLFLSVGVSALALIIHFSQMRALNAYASKPMIGRGTGCVG